MPTAMEVGMLVEQWPRVVLQEGQQVLNPTYLPALLFSVDHSLSHSRYSEIKIFFCS